MLTGNALAAVAAATCEAACCHAVPKSVQQYAPAMPARADGQYMALPPLSTNPGGSKQRATRVKPLGRFFLQKVVPLVVQMLPHWRDCERP